MVENLSSPALSENASSMKNESQILNDLGTGVSVCSKSMFALAKEIGFVSSVRSFYDRYRYTLKLWRLREVKIMQILCENYAKVPAWTPSKACAWLLITFPSLKRFLAKREIALKKSLTVNPFKGLTINNN